MLILPIIIIQQYNLYFFLTNAQINIILYYFYPSILTNRNQGNFIQTSTLSPEYRFRSLAHYANPIPNLRCQATQKQNLNAIIPKFALIKSSYSVNKFSNSITQIQLLTPSDTIYSSCTFSIHPSCTPNHSFLFYFIKILLIFLLIPIKLSLKLMNKGTTQYYFPPLTNAQIPSLLPSPVEAVCSFQIYPFEPNHAQNINISEVIKLEIRGEFILQNSMGSPTNQSGIKLDESFQFQIQPKEGFQNENQLLQAMNLNHIIFRWKDGGQGQKKQIQFRGVDRQQFQFFIRVLRKKIVIQTISEIQRYFEAVKIIGKGKTGKIFLSRRRSDNRHFVIKGVSRKNFSFKQVQIMKKLSHSNICKIYGLYYSKNSVYMLFSYYSFSLADWLKEPKYQLVSFPLLIRTLLEALRHMHQKGIIHRDIKPQNIMFKKNENQYEPILIDFDLAEYMDVEEYALPFCGTIGYMAPEILQNCLMHKEGKEGIKKYNESCDIFSLGATLYTLVTFNEVFVHHNIKQLAKINRECQINFNNERFLALPAQYQELLRKMLEKDPSKRITIEEALASNVCNKGSQNIHLPFNKTQQLAL